MTQNHVSYVHVPTYIICCDPKAPVMNIHIYLSPAAFDLKILFEGKTLQSSKSMGMTDSVLQISLAL